MAVKFTENHFVIEGIDGTGKTTQLELLRDHITKMGKSCIRTREPGGTVLGNAIREILKNPQIYRTPEQNVALFTVARQALAEEVIIPGLRSGQLIISDRSWLSTYAYQGYGEGFPLKKIVKITKDNIGLTAMMHRAVILDAEPAEIADRRTSEESQKDYFDSKDPQYFAEVRKGYLDVAEKYGFAIVNAAQPIEKVHTDILDALNLG